MTPVSHSNYFHDRFSTLLLNNCRSRRDKKERGGRGKEETGEEEKRSGGEVERRKEGEEEMGR